MYRSSNRHRTLASDEQWKRKLVLASLCLILGTRAAATDNHSEVLQPEEVYPSHLNFSKQRQVDNTTGSFNSVLNHLIRRVEDGNILIRKFSRCYGRDVRSQNCRKCVKTCKTQSKPLLRRLASSLAQFDASDVSLRMCTSSECMSCVDSCRESYGREFYIVAKPPGAKCETIF